MSISDEILAAYADGELDAAARAEIDEAARNEPGIAERIGRFRALRAQLQAAYAAELEEPVPDRLLETLQGPAPQSSPAVADLDAVRAARSRTPSRGTAASTRWRYSLAASVLVAVGVGFFAWQHNRPWAESGDGALVAQGSLAAGLSDELSGEPASGSPLRIGLSFVAKSGNYCRTFALAGDAGLACRHAGRWEIMALAKLPAAENSEPQFRTAGSPLPEKILQAVEARMSGEPLDRAGEIAARGNKWSKPPP
jgi:hypothetical protein